MDAFAEGRLQVLVTTTVIEVGIDVPNATVMTILGAQRFGLAQLHQLRGRVSRGSHAGHVCVFTDGEGQPEENERLKIFAETEDGFALAEADFRLRGPGDVLGRSQSGLPPMRIAELDRDFEILVVAREIAQAMVEADPNLEAEELGRTAGPSLAALRKATRIGRRCLISKRTMGFQARRFLRLIFSSLFLPLRQRFPLLCESTGLEAHRTIPELLGAELAVDQFPALAHRRGQRIAVGDRDQDRAG